MDFEYKSNLRETVYAIIDSRIQFIEYEQNMLLQRYATNNNSQNRDFTKDMSATPKLMHNLEKLIERIEQFSKTLKQLLVMRSNLRKENARVAFDLLTNNRYKEYSVEKLIQVLDLQLMEKI